MTKLNVLNELKESRKEEFSEESESGIHELQERISAMMEAASSNHMLIKEKQ